MLLCSRAGDIEHRLDAALLQAARDPARIVAETEP